MKSTIMFYYLFVTTCNILIAQTETKYYFASFVDVIRNNYIKSLICEKKDTGTKIIYNSYIVNDQRYQLVLSDTITDNMLRLAERNIVSNKIENPIKIIDNNIEYSFSVISSDTIVEINNSYSRVMIFDVNEIIADRFDTSECILKRYYCDFNTKLLLMCEFISTNKMEEKDTKNICAFWLLHPQPLPLGSIKITTN